MRALVATILAGFAASTGAHACSLVVDTGGLSAAVASGDSGTDSARDGAGLADAAADSDASVTTTRLTASIAADVVRISNMVVQLPSPELNAGLGQMGEVRQTGIRFRSVPLPRGAVILSAKLTMVSSENQHGDMTRSALSFQAADDALPWSSTFTDFDARARTTKIPWGTTMPAWSISDVFETVELASSLQPVVDRSGWFPGSAIALIWSDDGSVGTTQQRVAFTASGSKNDPFLTIRWR